MSTDSPQPIAWMNGEVIDAQQAAVPVGDLGVVAGASVTEFLRTFSHKPYRITEHLDRLKSSRNLLNFSTVVDFAELKNAVELVTAENAKLLPANHELGLIAFITAGQNLTYLGASGRDRVSQGTVCIHSFPLPFELWASAYETGQHLATVSVPPLPKEAVEPQAKHRNRLHWKRADEEARENSGARSLLVSPDGFLTETSSGNLFVLKGNSLLTPREETVLGGISRGVLMELAATEGLEVGEADLTPVDLATADEALVTSTPYCVIPVTKFNGESIGDGQPGPVFRRLMAAWSDTVGVDIVQQAQLCATERS